MREASEKEGDAYGYLKGRDEAICDEALATMIGDRGGKLVEKTGLGAELKAWLKEFWKAFKGAFGIADLTDEQVEKMTLGDFVDAINAELLRGKDFGTKKAKPLEKRSIKRFDEDENAGANGMLRWKNDRGYVFTIPVDLARTEPGGKVVFARDDAEITDWIKNALNGYTLRLSKRGNLYVEGRDGLPPELAEIFGRYPTIGDNDGIYDRVRDETGRDNGSTPEDLVKALRADRSAYDAWKEGRNAETEYLAEQQEREQAEAQEHWENSGMNAVDYIRSRIEEGAPEFDLDWEIARELENDRAEGRFMAKKEKTVINRPRAWAEGSSDGVPDSQSDASPLRLPRKSGGTVRIVSNDGKKVKARIRKFNNRDFRIDTGNDRSVGAIVKSMCKALGLRQKGSYNSHYGIFETPDGKVAFRLSGHTAEGDNFKQNGTLKNTSVVIQMYDLQHGESTVPFEEFVYPKEVFDANREKIVAAILNGVGKMIDTGKFEDSTGLAKYSENKGANFRRWFADSKVVDEAGNPLVVYRGASYDPLAQPMGEGVIKPEAYFTADPEYAKRYGKVNSYYLRIRKPLDVRNKLDRQRLSEFYPKGYKFALGRSGALDWAEMANFDIDELRQNTLNTTESFWTKAGIRSLTEA